MNFILQDKMLQFDINYLRTERISNVLLNIQQVRQIFGMHLNRYSKMNKSIQAKKN